MASVSTKGAPAKRRTQNTASRTDFIVAWGTIITLMVILSLIYRDPITRFIDEEIKTHSIYGLVSNRANAVLAPPVVPLAGGRYALTANTPALTVHASPGGPVIHTLANPQASGAPLTLLLKNDPGAGWYEVSLPVRPNGTTGFVKATDVTAAEVAYRLVMHTDRNQLELFHNDQLVRTMVAASGTGDTPTPKGSFFLTELMQPPTPDLYGPYAYGTSGFSEVLTSFAGGPGQIGLHGTNDASSIGQAVSHGCIRLSDEDITYLAQTLPLGTPIEIL